MKKKTNKKESENLTDQVMSQIARGEVKMKSRFHFLAGSILLGVGTAGMTFLTVFFVHLVMFHLRTKAPFVFLRLGRLGWRPFAMQFPWLPLVLAFVGLVGGLSLFRRYDFSYRRGFGVMVVSLLVFVLTFGYLLDYLKPEVPLGQIRHLSPLYQLPPSAKGILLGVVEEIGENEVLLETASGEQVKVVWDEQTRMPPGQEVLEAGDHLRVIGDWENDVFEAKGMLKDQPQPGMGPGPGPEKVNEPRYLRKGF